MTPKSALLPVTLLAPLLFACGDAPDRPADPQRTDSAGVELVVNPAMDRSLDWSFQETLRIGGADEGPESFFEVYDESVAVSPDGTIYVMDRGNHRLKAFDDRGRHLWSAGREGKGPGEFQFPGAVTADPRGGATVVDYGRRSTIRYSARGEFLDESLMGSGDFFGAEVSMPLEGVQVSSWREQLPDQGLERRLLSYVEGSDTVTLQEHQAPLAETIRVDACGSPLAMRLGPFFAPGFHWDARERRVASAWGWPDYRVDVHMGGRLVSSIRRAGARPPVDSDAVRADHPEGFSVSFGGEPCELDLGELMEKRGVASVLPAVADLALSPSGELWIERQVPGTDHPIDVFDEEGTYLGTLSRGTPFPAAFFPDGRVVTVEETELEIPTVRVYRIVEDPGEGPAG